MQVCLDYSISLLILLLQLKQSISSVSCELFWRFHSREVSWNWELLDSAWPRAMALSAHIYCFEWNSLCKGKCLWNYVKEGGREIKARKASSMFVGMPAENGWKCWARALSFPAVFLLFVIRALWHPILDNWCIWLHCSTSCDLPSVSARKAICQHNQCDASSILPDWRATGGFHRHQKPQSRNIPYSPGDFFLEDCRILACSGHSFHLLRFPVESK